MSRVDIRKNISVLINLIIVTCLSQNLMQYALNVYDLFANYTQKVKLKGKEYIKVPLSSFA